MKTKKILVIFTLIFTIISANAQIKVNSNGKIIIGPTTTWADYVLNITGSGDLGSGGKISIGDNSTSTLNVIIGEYGTTDTDQLLLHGDNGIHFSTTESLSTKMFLNENGNVGIGTSSISARLDIMLIENGKGLQLRGTNKDIDLYLGHDGTDFGFYWRYKGTASGNDKDLELWTNGETGSDKQVYNVHQNGRIGFNQNVGIGKTEPGYKLDVYGSNVMFDYTSRPLRFNLGVSDPRICSDYKVVFFKTDQTDWIDVECKNVIEKSDISDKENILRIENGLNKVKQLNGITFNWKDDINGRTNAGLIAQDVEKVIPEVVFKVDSTKKKLISYTKIIPFLIEAIKEQQLIIDSLAYEISVIKNSNSGNLKSVILTSIENLNEQSGKKPILYQNVPNPFNQDTEIKFDLPERTSNAKLFIYNMQGNQLRSINITQRGYGSEIIQGSDLQPGMYLYTLITDGVEVDTKRMILTD